VVAATNRDLKALVEQGLMREDFFYRIHVIPIRLPPLRERKEDLSLLIDHFLLSHGGSRPPITADVLEAFHRYDWPGNVRELGNVLKRYLTLHRLDFPELAGRPRPAATPEPQPPGGQSLEERIDALERSILDQTLREQRWHRERTAAALGIHRKTLFTKLKKHGLI
jgi:DNA-binding NtrC family response regulator